MSKKKNVDYGKVKDMVDQQISEGQKAAAKALDYYTENPPEDPQKGIEVNNDELEALIVKYGEESTDENLNQLVRLLHDSRILSPADINMEGKPTPCLISSPEHGTYLPIYTSKTHIPDKPRSAAVLNIPYMAANQMTLNEGDNVEGLVINPFSHNLVFKKPLVQRIDEIDKALRSQPKVQKIQLTQEQYVNFERHQFEAVHMPERLFKEGQEFIDVLCEKKEVFIDEFYEETFQQNRLYPYLPEDFAVLPMDISDDLLVVRVDFPAKNIVQGCSQRAYIAWKKQEQKGQYFLIEAIVQGAPYTLAEVREDHRHISRGEAPVEGAELQRIIDIVNGDAETDEDIIG